MLKVSAQAQMCTLLDQLMGTSWDVCKSHFLNCCPHDVLSGTRMDLGECLKVHDLVLRADYEIASKDQDFSFELDAMDHLQSFIADCDRRTEVAKKRLAETQEEISAEAAAKAERAHELNEEIRKLLAKVEQLGADGNVEESQEVMDRVEKAQSPARPKALRCLLTDLSEEQRARTDVLNPCGTLYTLGLLTVIIL
uniref:LUC7-like protein n=1 Tax=Otus sunia TaxID=257818 RepID=A0A8C8AAL1_9STRI